MPNNIPHKTWLSATATIAIVPPDEGAKEVIPTALYSSLSLSPDIMEDVYYSADRSTYSPDGFKALSQLFIQGLIANIHTAHQAKVWDSAEHLRFIIGNLEKGFATPMDARHIPVDDFPNEFKSGPSWEK